MTEQPRGEAVTEISFLTYCRTVWKWKWLLVLLAATASLISYVYAVRLPKVYVATAVVMVPKDTAGMDSSTISISIGGGGSAAASKSDSAGGTPISLTLPSASAMKYLALLRSRTLHEDVVAHLKPTWKDAVEGHAMTAEDTKDGTVVLRVESSDPDLSAEIANHYFQGLLDRIAIMSTASVRAGRLFYEAQLATVAEDLNTAQQELLAFQERHRIALSAGQERKAASEAGAAASVAAMEMELTLLRTRFTDNHPDVVAFKRRLLETKRLLSQALYGDPRDLPPEREGGAPRKEFFVPQAKQLSLEFQLREVYRTFRFREAIYNTLITNVESARYLERSRDTPPTAIEWVDKAVPSRRPIRPNIFYNVAAAAVGGVVAGIFLAFALEYFTGMRAVERVRLRVPAALAAKTTNGSSLTPEVARRPEGVRERDPRVGAAEEH